MLVRLFVRLLAEWAFCRSKYNLRFCPHRKTYSCVFWFTDVVGWHVALPALWLPEPPVTVASHVLKLQYPQLLIGWDTQLIGTTGIERVESVVNLKETNKKAMLVACFDSTRVVSCLLTQKTFHQNNWWWSFNTIVTSITDWTVC